MKYFCLAVMRPVLVVASVVVCILAPGRVAADDWPQWRGEGRDGVWRETGIVDALPSGLPGNRLPRKWAAPVGSGYSGPTVANGKVYLTDRQVEVVEGRELERERVLCFDAETGAVVWAHTYDAPYEIGYRAGPRAAVTIDSGLAISVGAMGQMFCFAADTGKILWEHNLNREYSIEMPIWGIAGAPLVHQGNVIQIVGGADGAGVVAFDLQDGREVWQSLDEKIGYSSPTLIEQAGQPVVVCWTGESVSGLNPTDGSVFWSVPLPSSRMPIGIATPIIENNRLFVTSFYDGALMIDVPSDKLQASVLWQFRGPDEQQTEALHSIISTPVMDKGYLYGVDSYGELRCLDAATGERLWEDDTAVPRARWATIHFVKQGDRYWMFNDQGMLTIAELSPEGYLPLSQALLIEPTTDQLPRRNGVTWSHPAFANKTVYIRNDKELIAVDLAK